MLKKFIILLTLVVFLFVGCSKNEKNPIENNNTALIEEAKDSENLVDQSEESKKEIADTGSHQVIDHAGNTVEVPNKIEKIVIDQIPILSTYMAYFQGETPYIVGFAGSFKDSISKTVLKDISPELMDSQSTVYAQGDLNLEEIQKLSPDIIFYNANNQKHAEELKKLNIPMVGFATIGHDTPADSLLRYKQWLELLEDVFGEEGKMDTMFQEGDKIIAEVKEKIDSIPEEKRPSGLILFKYMNGIPQVAGKGVFGDFWLKNLGIRNLAGDINGFPQVNLEEIYKWDPDILFLNGPGLLNLRTEDVLNNQVEGADFSKLKAVKEARVYNTSLGMWSWFTPNPDAPLVYAWLATKTYPEEFKDYPLEEKIKDYYKTFYNYQLNEDEIKEMLSF